MAENGTGRIAGRLILLALPLLVGNVFQQCYNITSSLVIGRFVGMSAFAALGVAGTVMNLYIFVLSGCCVGISVVLATLYGNGDLALLRRGIFLSAVAGGVLTLALSVFSVLSLPLVLRLIDTPAELRQPIAEYLDIILGGLIATFLYNFCAAVLRAVGRTGAALCFLIAAVVLNAVLTFVLVAHAGWGISGAGWATVFAQAFSGALCLAYIRRRLPFLVVGRDDICCDGVLLRRIAHFACVSALHQSSLYLGKMFVQGAVNALGTVAIAAYTAAGRIEGFANAFGDSGAEALSIFTAHRVGAGDTASARRGLFVGLTLLAVLGVFCSAAMFAFAAPSVRLFTGGGDAGSSVVDEGARYLATISIFYLLAFVGSAFVGYFRGSGRINVPFVGTTLQIGLRVIFSYALTPVLGLNAVALATGIGWSAIVIFQLVLYRRQKSRGSISVM